LEEPKSKPLIQYNRKGRKLKSVVGQGKHGDVGFLKWGFLESSLSSLSQAERGFLGRGYSNQARTLNFVGGLQAISPLELSLVCSLVFEDKGDKTVAFLSTHDEDHRRWDMIEDCELYGLRIGLFCGLFLIGSVVRLLYTPCVLRASYVVFLIKLQLLIKKKKKININLIDLNFLKKIFKLNFEKKFIKQIFKYYFK